MMVDLYCRCDETLKMKVPTEGNCTASGGSSFPSLAVQGNNELVL